MVKFVLHLHISFRISICPNQVMVSFQSLLVTMNCYHMTRQAEATMVKSLPVMEVGLRPWIFYMKLPENLCFCLFVPFISL